jgi:PAS domain S-box-containing protein
MSQSGTAETLRTAARRQSYAPALVALIAGTAVSLAVSFGLRHWEWQRIQIEFASAAHDRCTAIEKALEEHQLVLESVQSLYASSYAVERGEFQAFVAPLLSRLPSIQALEWIPRVPAAQRAEYEEAGRKDGLEGFQISERDERGHARRAARRPEYFPVYYVEPRRGNEPAVGYDLGSNRTRLDALRRAMDSGEAAATARVTLVQEKEKSFGFLIFVPLYANGMPTASVADRRQALRGFALGVFRLAGIVETALSRLYPGGVDIRLEDLSAPAEERFLYFHPSRSRPTSSPPAADGEIDGLDNALSLRQHDIGGRNWRFLCSPAPGYVSAHRTWQPWGTLAGGLAFTGLLTTYYFASIRQAVRTQRALGESESRFRGVIETSPDAIVMIAPDGRTLLANQQAARVLGYPSVAEMLAGAPNALEVLAPEDRPRAVERVRELLEVNVLRDHQYSLIRRDGSRFTAEVSSSLQRDFHGDPRAVIVVLRDITQRKQAEQLLQQAKEAAEAANRAKSEFLANMSHEIRTPMTAILGFTDLLTRPDLPQDKKDEFLQVIRRNGKALLKLINDILDLSKIEAEKLTLDKGDCALQQIVGDAMSLARVQAEAKKLALQVDYEFPLPERIHTDPVRLRQILVNLLGNAVKFTERGAVRLAVRCLRSDGGAAQVQFAVSDTGIGIPPDKIAELFQPFMQADASATRRYGGTGLGLAISQRLANALSGDIQVTSELGRGSTFTLTIQVGSLQGVPMLPAFSSTPAAGEELPPGRLQPTLQGRLLVAEDSPDVQLLVRNLLDAMGLEVEIADNGQTACDMARQAKAAGRPYDLILLDIQMPQRNGYEATAWLRQQGWQGPIVAMTAHAMVGDREKCLEAGCNDYLAKPLTAAALRDVLARHLGPAAALR